MLVRWKFKSGLIASAGQLLMDEYSAGLLYKPSRCYLSSLASCEAGREIPMLMQSPCVIPAEFHVNRVMLTGRATVTFFCYKNHYPRKSFPLSHKYWVSVLVSLCSCTHCCFSFAIPVIAFSFYSVSLQPAAQHCSCNPWNAAISGQEVGRYWHHFLALPYPPGNRECGKLWKELVVFGAGSESSGSKSIPSDGFESNSRSQVNPENVSWAPKVLRI